MVDLQIERPIPIPFDFVVKNASNMWSMSFASIPVPMLRPQFVPQQVKHATDEIVQIELGSLRLFFFEHCPDAVDHLGGTVAVFDHILERHARFLKVWRISPQPAQAGSCARARHPIFGFAG
ncbi:MAG: hypothetical protein WAK55_00785 [Xanthobacteraceae bacterium]